jgi:hypothetical protein
MPVTTLINPAGGFKAWALQARTNTSGTAVDDAGGEDARVLLEAYTAGVLQPTAFQVLQNSPTGMSVRVGSNTAKNDVAILQGTTSGQGKYAVRNEDAVTVVNITAADASNPRIDEIYTVVQDHAYDSSSRVLPRIGYRRGDAAGSPSAPGPDAAWRAHLLVATVNVAASATQILNANIIDNRVQARVADGGVATGSIQDSAVTTAKIDDAAVTNAKVAASFMESRMATQVVSSNANLSLTTAFQDVVALNFSRPSGWSTYEVLAMGSCVFDQGTGEGVPEAQIKVGASTGGLSAPGLSVSRVTLTPSTRFVGQTAATLAVSVQARHTGAGGSAQTKRSANISIIAFRTS